MYELNKIARALKKPQFYCILCGFDQFNYVICYVTRLHRLMVRTPGFHPGNRGSIPLGAARRKNTRIIWCFFFVVYNPFSCNNFKALEREKFADCQSALFCWSLS